MDRKREKRMKKEKEGRKVMMKTKKDEQEKTFCEHRTGKVLTGNRDAKRRAA